MSIIQIEQRLSKTQVTLQYQGRLIIYLILLSSSCISTIVR